jgi:hypothetical protein
MGCRQLGRQQGARDDQAEEDNRQGYWWNKDCKQKATDCCRQRNQARAAGDAAAPAEGATVDQISASIGWQAHSVRGAMSGTLKKKQGLTITSDKAQDGQRVYRIAA